MRKTPRCEESRPARSGDRYNYDAAYYESLLPTEPKRPRKAPAYLVADHTPASRWSSPIEHRASNASGDARAPIENQEPGADARDASEDERASIEEQDPGADAGGASEGGAGHECKIAELAREVERLKRANERYCRANRDLAAQHNAAMEKQRDAQDHVARLLKQVGELEQEREYEEGARMEAEKHCERLETTVKRLERENEDLGRLESNRQDALYRRRGGIDSDDDASGGM